MHKLNDNHARLLHGFASHLLLLSIVAAMLFVEVVPTWILIAGVLGAFGLWTVTGERL